MCCGMRLVLHARASECACSHSYCVDLAGFLFIRLSNSQGNLLDDTELIDVLAITKQTAQDVTEKLLNASDTNKKINEACEEYRPVAHRATLVYFLIAEYSIVNCMYQTSLGQFNELYELAIDNSEKATMPSKRIQNIIDHMTYEIYLYIQRGLFERHKVESSPYHPSGHNALLLEWRMFTPSMCRLYSHSCFRTRYWRPLVQSNCQTWTSS